jgi:hypothetical protein
MCLINVRQRTLFTVLFREHNGFVCGPTYNDMRNISWSQVREFHLFQELIYELGFILYT